MTDLVKITLVFNNANRGVAVNSFVWNNNDPIAADSVILSRSEQWMQAIFTPLRAHMSNQYTLSSGQVDEINPADGKVLRHIGNINPSVSGTSGLEMLPTVDAASALARTNVPKVRGTKRFGGLTEATQVNGLFLNPLVSALATAAAEWLAGTGLSLIDQPGVWSSKESGFVPFANSGAVTNVPGTQVSRKPGRGA